MTLCVCVCVFGSERMSRWRRWSDGHGRRPCFFAKKWRRRRDESAARLHSSSCIVCFAQLAPFAAPETTHYNYGISGAAYFFCCRLIFSISTAHSTYTYSNLSLTIFTKHLFYKLLFLSVSLKCKTHFSDLRSNCFWLCQCVCAQSFTLNDTKLQQ